MTHSGHVPGCVLSRKDTVFETGPCTFAKPSPTVHKGLRIFGFQLCPLTDSESQCAFTWREARSNFRDGIGDRHRDLETARVTVEDY